MSRLKGTEFTIELEADNDTLRIRKIDTDVLTLSFEIIDDHSKSLGGFDIDIDKLREIVEFFNAFHDQEK